MGTGPFTTYVPPGTYTQTNQDANVSSLVAGLRIPVFIGVGQEELEQTDLELVRGSSANLDVQIVAEDVSASFVVDETNPNNPILGAPNGVATKVRVRNTPIVDGQGFGRVTNDVRSVSATVNGQPVAIGAVEGQKGYVVFQVPPMAGDDVRVTYYFHRNDTAFTDDVSDQVTATNAELTSPAHTTFTFVAGTTDTFEILVNGVSSTVKFTAGTLTASGVKSVFDAAGISNLTTSVFVDNMGAEHVKFTSTVSVEIGTGNANGVFGWSAGTKTNRNTEFRVFQRPIVDGTDGGITTTDPSKVVVKVNGTQVVPTSVDGKNGIVTLPTPPAPGSTVKISYWANTWQDTYDYLPHTLVTSALHCGISPGRSDYIEGTDFVISNPRPDVSIVHWGTSFVVASGTHTAGADLFDESHIIGTLVDDKLYKVECERVVDTTTIPATVSATEFTLPQIPTLGNGRDTPLATDLFESIANSRNAVDVNRPDLVEVYVGRNLRDAMSRPAVTVLSVDATTRKITLKDAVPSDYKAYATFWYNRIQDSTYIFMNKVAGATGVGQFEVLDTKTNDQLYQVRFGTKGGGLTETVQWPRGVENIPDAFHYGGNPVSETVTITFDTVAATNAVYTNKGSAPYSLYAPASATWVSVVNGTSVSTNLATATRGYLVGKAVQPIQTGADAGKIAVPASPNNVLELTIDGVDITATITAGNRTPAEIVNDINSAIDADATFAGTAPNNLADYVQVGPSTGDVYFYIQSYSTPAALPNGFDHKSTISVRQGTIETFLGFATYQAASGSPQIVNKPATILGTKAGPFNITSGLNDTLEIRVDGIDYQVTLTAGASVSAATIVSDINSVPGLSNVASVGTLDNTDHVRLTSQTNTDTSSITILSGNANTVLGFTSGDVASQTRVNAQEIVNSLNATSGFISNGALAYVTDDHVTIMSTSVGATASSIAFSTSTNSAFNTTTGLNITPGLDGDIGEDAQDIYTVSSNMPLGSSGTGIPGQTYTDARTGLRFTILPATTGSYTSGGTFTLEVSPTFIANAAVPFYAIPGLETLVPNTVGIGVNDTGTLQTFNAGGTEPKVGDFYHISYRYMKQDFSTRIFRQFKSITANYGPISTENRVALAAYLAILNGAVLVGIKQVLKTPGTNQAPDSAYIEAIDELKTPLPGNIKPDILVPLTTSTAVYSYLTQHCEVMSNIRNQSERMGFIGFASGTTPTAAATIAKGLNSNRIIAVYPDSAVVTLTDELGASYELLVDGSFLAAAVAGAVVSPAVDVATPYTRRHIQGFTRLPRILDPVSSNQLAVSGVTLLEDLDTVIRIRHGLTTNMESVLTRTPTVTQISDYMQQRSRALLDVFIGTKFLSKRINDIDVALTAFFKQQLEAEIIQAFTGIATTVDPDDPTILHVEAYYAPIFPLLYIVLTYSIRTRV